MLAALATMVETRGLVGALLRRRLEALWMNAGNRAIDRLLRSVFGDHRVLVTQLDGTLEQTRMEVEDVAGIGLAPGRTAKQQRELAVGLGLFGEIVVDQQSVLAFVVHEVFGHRRTRVRGDVLKRRRVRGSRRYHDRVIERAVLGELVDHADHGRLLQADRDVNADHAGALLIENRVDGNRCLSGLAVADDQLALAAADRDHRVNRLDPGLERLVHGLTAGDTRRLVLERTAMRSFDHPLAVQRPAERIDHAADERLAARNTQELAGPADLVPFLDVEIVAEDDDTHRALFEVEHLAELAVGELELLTRHGVGQAIDTRNPITDLEHAADFAEVYRALIVSDLLGQNRRDLVHVEFHLDVSTLPGCLRNFGLIIDRGQTLDVLGGAVEQAARHDVEFARNTPIQLSITGLEDQPANDLGVHPLE